MTPFDSSSPSLPPPPESWSHRTTAGLVVAIGVVALIGVVAWQVFEGCCGSLFGGRTEPQSARGMVEAGARCRIQAGDAESVPVAASKAALERLNQFAEAKDETGVNQLTALGLVFLVARNTAAKVIDLEWGLTEVRIESGPHEGRLAWVNHRFLVR